MKAEIISVGTEIILGDILNTHSRFLSRELAALGIDVYYQTAVGDNDKRFTQMLKTALERSDIVFLTGGLGPTTDDITKETACRLLDIPCVHSPVVEERIRDYFIRSNRTFTENNCKQAQVPEGAFVLHNDWGTAPGFIIVKEGKTVVLLPGPPRELQPMFLQRVKPFLVQLSCDIILSKNVRVFGIGESALEAQLADLVTSQNPTVALYAKDGEVLVRVTSKEKDLCLAEKKIDEMILQLNARLGSAVYGVDVESMQQVVVKQLIQEKLTIAVAESCTGGMLAEKLTQISGASEAFELGIVTYANRIKEQELGVAAETLQKYGAVSEQTAIEMAAGLYRKSGANLNVSITGIAGPTGAVPGKPVGTVYIAVVYHGKVWCQRFDFARNKGEREYIRNLACLNALNMVRLTLEDNRTEQQNYRNL